MVARIVVTGASGFIGRATIPHLRRLGFEVHGVARSSRPVSEAADWWPCDLLEPGAIEAILDRVRPTYLIHAAWTTDHGTYWTSPANERWVEASRRLVDCFRRLGGRRIVGVGTCAEYDWTRTPRDGRFAEDHPANPATVYGRAKLDFGRWLCASRADAAWARLFYGYGPGENEKRLIPSLIVSSLRGAPVEVGPTTLARDFLHVDDIGRALAALANSDVSGAFNIASGEATTLGSIVDRLGTLLDTRLVRLGARPIREGEPVQLVASVTRLAEVLHFKPAISLGDGLRQAVDYWRERVS